MAVILYFFKEKFTEKFLLLITPSKNKPFFVKCVEFIRIYKTAERGKIAFNDMEDLYTCEKLSLPFCKRFFVQTGQIRHFIVLDKFRIVFNRNFAHKTTV